MKAIKWSLLLVLILSFGLFAYIGCGDDDDDDDGSGGTGNFQLHLVDAPIDIADNVFLTIEAVSANGPSGWVDLDVEAGRYDLLSLQNNAFAVLADQILEVGDYKELRLVLTCEGDEAPEIVIEGESYPLKVPSGCSSGFKLKGTWTIGTGEETVLIMDFDARKSITETGSDKYILNPVVRVIQKSASGNIIGAIDPAVSRAVVYAFDDGAYTDENWDDAVGSTIVEDDGSFVLTALPAGTYDIAVLASGYTAKVYVEDVVVPAGEDVTLDPIILEASPS